MFKRILASVLAGVLAAAALTGCGSGNIREASPEETAAPYQTQGTAAREDKGMAAGENKEEAGGGSEVSATLTFMAPVPDDARRKAMDNALNRFHEKYPNVKVEINEMDTDSLKTKLKTVMGAGAGSETPDLFMTWGGEWLKEFVGAGKVLDMTDYIADFKDEYNDYAFDFATYDDHIYGIVQFVGPATVFYNRQIFDELGLELPGTYEELTLVCEKIKEAGYIPFALGNKNSWPGLIEYCLQILRRGGLEGAKGLQDRTIPFNADFVVESGQALENFVKAGYYPQGVNGIDHTSGGTRMMFYSGQAAMFIMVNDFLGNCKSEDPEFYENNLGAFQYPVIEGGKDTEGKVSLGGGMVINVSSATEYPEIAVELVHYLTDLEFGQEYCDEGAVLSGAKGIVVTDPLVKGQLQVLEETEYLHNYFDQAYSPNMGQVLKDNTQAVYGLEMTPQEAADSIEAVASQDYGPVK